MSNQRNKDRNVDPEILKERRVWVYQRRNNLLKSLGYQSYQEYLASPLWQKIREEVLEKKPNCYCCGRPATQVHHMSYMKNDLLGIRRRRLRSICGTCHELSEYRESDGLKMTPTGANTLQRKLMKKHRRVEEMRYINNGTCKFCKQEIRWFRHRNGKFVPVNTTNDNRHVKEYCQPTVDDEFKDRLEREP